MNYLIDESFVYPQAVSEYDDLGTVTTEYHRGLGLISMYNGINERFYRYDALGSVLLGFLNFKSFAECSEF